MPGNPPVPGALPAPAPLPRLPPDPSPTPGSDPVPRPVLVPVPAGFKPAPCPLPYRPPLPLPDPPPTRLDSLPPVAASARASPWAMSDRVPVPAAGADASPAFAPTAGSAITVTSAGATANNPRASARGRLGCKSGGGGMAFSTSRPSWCRRAAAISETSDGLGALGGAGLSGRVGLTVARSGMALDFATGKLIFGAATGVSGMRGSATLPLLTTITSWAAVTTDGAAGLTILGRGTSRLSRGGFFSAG